MLIMWTILAAAFVGGILMILWTKGNYNRDGVAIAGGAVSVIAVFIAAILGFMTFLPNYSLYKAEIDREVIVVEARERALAAKEEAKAEVYRAEGTAQANEIVANSITEPYLRYLYILNLGNTDNQVIYLPTEAGLPILEAERFSQEAR